MFFEGIHCWLYSSRVSCFAMMLVLAEAVKLQKDPRVELGVGENFVKTQTEK